METQTHTPAERVRRKKGSGGEGKGGEGGVGVFGREISNMMSSTHKEEGKKLVEKGQKEGGPYACVCVC
jgi:hypothetical protein